LLLKGDAAGAVEKFKRANAQGPRFADALEGWGEALVMQNRSDRALPKFAEAARYAPNWKRLHRKWGEALSYLGKTGEAAKQLAIARSLHE
jgi:tetratricopeptide (TPR) repeat protein